LDLLTGIDICIFSRKGRSFFFRVQYETKIGNQWHPVVRYDTAHGFSHRDLLDIFGNTKKTPLLNQDFNDALTFAENDLKTNWSLYKRAFTEDMGDE
jgi:hypothetical protein